MDCILVWTPVWTAYCWTTYSMDCILLSSRQRDLKKKTFLFISVKIASCYGLQFSNVKYLLSLLPSGSPCTCGCIVRLQYCDFFFLFQQIFCTWAAFFFENLPTKQTTNSSNHCWNRSTCRNHSTTTNVQPKFQAQKPESKKTAWEAQVMHAQNMWDKHYRWCTRSTHDITHTYTTKTNLCQSSFRFGHCRKPTENNYENQAVHNLSGIYPYITLCLFH